MRKMAQNSDFLKISFFYMWNLLFLVQLNELYPTIRKKEKKSCWNCGLWAFYIHCKYLKIRLSQSVHVTGRSYFKFGRETFNLTRIYLTLLINNTNTSIVSIKFLVFNDILSLPRLFLSWECFIEQNVFYFWS